MPYSEVALTGIKVMSSLYDTATMAIDLRRGVRQRLAISLKLFANAPEDVFEKLNEMDGA